MINETEETIPGLTPVMSDVLRRAAQITARRAAETISTVDVLIAIAEHPVGQGGKLFADLDISGKDLRALSRDLPLHETSRATPPPPKPREIHIAPKANKIYEYGKPECFEQREKLRSEDPDWRNKYEKKGRR